MSRPFHHFSPSSQVSRKLGLDATWRPAMQLTSFGPVNPHLPPVFTTGPKLPRPHVVEVAQDGGRSCQVALKILNRFWAMAMYGWKIGNHFGPTNVVTIMYNIAIRCYQHIVSILEQQPYLVICSRAVEFEIIAPSPCWPLTLPQRMGCVSKVGKPHLQWSNY